MDKTQIETGKGCCQIERKQIRTKAFSFWSVRTCRVVEFGMSLLERTELLNCIEGEGNADGKGKSD